MLNREAAFHQDIFVSRVKTLRKSRLEVARDARRDSVFPKRAPIAQRRLLKRWNHPNKCLSRLDIAQFADAPDSPKWGAIGFANIRPHGSAPTKRLHKLIADRRQFLTKPVAAIVGLAPSRSRQGHCRDQTRSQTCQSHLLQWVRPSEVVSGESENHRLEATVARLGLTGCEVCLAEHHDRYPAKRDLESSR